MSNSHSIRDADAERTDFETRADTVSLDIDFEEWFWLPQPTQVDVVLYADGSIHFTGGGFQGLDRVIDAIDNDPWFWVDFDLTTAHRGSDSSADMSNQSLEQIQLDDYDELWLFGYSSADEFLSNGEDGEISAVESFMDDGGGVLTTGDHANLGRGLSGAIKRVGEMRKYPAPPTGVEANTTIRDANMDGRHANPEQSDATPQDIRLKEYRLWSSVPSLFQYSQPHAVLCGPDGPIDVFPDHQHEGEINVPNSYPTEQWPSKAGHQPQVEPIAWGEIVDPQAIQTGQDFPIVGVYDGHRADVGRIVADSTWHHWFDINLDGFAANAPDVLDQLEAYFRNVAVWLAPEGAQRRMRNALTWGNFWFDPLVMLDPVNADPFRLGGTARDAFGRFAPQCTITDWLHRVIEPELRVRLDELRTGPPEIGPEPPLPIEELVLGEAVRGLSEQFSDADQAVEFPGHEVLDEAYAAAGEQAVDTLSEYHETVTDRVLELG
ncbi:hypothetical protein BRC77_05100 [Halobacteriales archaeon QH_8_64_26]|nr:MAG: hypothetical protein BRC77_05100 [Halobacteriales archaeon QH_8_64_26]